MGLFNFRGNKEKSNSRTGAQSRNNSYALVEFDCYYLYGLSDSPYRQSASVKNFETLYRRVVGDFGGIVIGSSFHPYQLVNTKDVTVWHAAYLQHYLHDKKEEIFRAISEEKAIFYSDPSATFNEYLVWPDSRLSVDENPVFSRYVPFVIPFLVYQMDRQSNWDTELTLDIAGNGNGNTFVGEITQMIRFFMPEPSFILGFDKFEEQEPSKLIDQFILFKELLE